MQRKNNLLNISHKTGFAMIMAIASVVVISGIMALSLSMNTLSAKKTTDIYLYEQAQLYTKSATEYALLQISKQGPCLPKSINTTFGANAIGDINNIYNVNINLLYVYNKPCGNDFTQVVTPEQNASVLIDIIITTSSNVSSKPIRVTKRTIQKL
jgi:hypothetical protein